MAKRSPLGNWIKRHLPFNRQTYLHDVSALPPAARRPRSKIIQFYSSYRNIGNFTPVLGIQGMLGEATDVWDMHQTPVDWAFVNRHYRAAIIGGAGLLNACFDPFWRDFDANGRLPFVIWGMGVCMPHNEVGQGVDRAVARRVFERSMLSNVRDLLTVRHYGLGEDVDVSVCPTVPYLHSLARREPGRFGRRNPQFDVLHSIHTTLTDASANERINQAITGSGRSLVCTENLQRYRTGIDDVLAMYLQAGTVVTTRLHGAIISYGFDVPYIALSFDSKVQAFVELYGGGRLCTSVDELPALLAAAPPPTGSAAAAGRALAFGERARRVLHDATRLAA